MSEDLTKLKERAEAAKYRAEISDAQLKSKASNLRKKEMSRLYEAATNDAQHPRRGSNYSADATIQQSTDALRNYARWLDENHDLAIGILDELENRIVGRGIQISPRAKDKNGKPAKEWNAAVLKLFKLWCKSKPEASRTLTWTEIQRLLVRTKFRDGEVFIQHLEGKNAGIKHTGPVPYSIELIEPDFCPYNYMRSPNQVNGQRKILAGVEINAWKQPIGYHMFREHPGDMLLALARGNYDTKFISAEQVTHLKFVRRLSQVRGVSVMHGVLRRLEDIKEYEESERIAARVAAAFTAIITKDKDTNITGTYNSTTNQRQLEMSPGMIFDNLMPGENIETIGSDRPNTNLPEYRGGQLRAVASGTKTNASSISKDYRGTYSSQRQELVEGQEGYATETKIMADSFFNDVYTRFVDMAVMSGRVSVEGIDIESLYDFAYVGPAVPWIEPKKEAEAQIMLKNEKIKSRRQVQQGFGLDPEETDNEIEADNLMSQQQELVLPKKPDDELETETEEDEENERDIDARAAAS